MLCHLYSYLIRALTLSFNFLSLPLSYSLLLYPYTDKKENQILLIYKEIKNGAVAKSSMTNVLLIYGEVFAHFLIY
jgi:hypothetical protein